MVYLWVDVQDAHLPVFDDFHHCLWIDPVNVLLVLAKFTQSEEGKYMTA